MFDRLAFFNATESVARLDALGRSQAIIEFGMDGTIVTANENFLNTMGYSLAEVQGRHHSMFVEPGYKDSAEYRQFWEKLNRGEYQRAQFRRIGKGGKEIWIQASYNPVLGKHGKPVKVIKFATDITAQKAEYADILGQIEAIHKSQAVIEFNLDGTILKANNNFLDALGYTLAEVQGKHHSMFVDPAYARSDEYRQFWQKLGRGEYQAAQYKRHGKGGRVVWIQASYNPILDLNGRPFKIVKYATDISKQVELLDNLKGLIDTNFGEIDTAMAHSTRQAGTGVQAITEASAGVQTVAASAEELAASIREISDTMTKSKAATDSAHTETATADQATQRLADATEAMGSIVALIQNITNQINLLALNATIESARAGAAGKGFAVVASEVKTLAKQASQATDQIKTEIGRVQSVSGEVVTALHAIGKSIGLVHEYVTVTVAAVEEQSSVTQNVSASMQMAANAVQTVNGNMTEISAAVAQAAQAVERTKAAAQVLAR